MHVFGTLIHKNTEQRSVLSRSAVLLIRTFSLTELRQSYYFVCKLYLRVCVCKSGGC